MAQNIRVVNTLTYQEHTLLVCIEETLMQIRQRYMKEFNSHANAYTWKHLGKVLDMKKSLSENGVDIQALNLAHAGMNELEWMPTLHLYFNDDLTV